MGKEQTRKISDLIEIAMKNLTEMVDVNTIMGSAIKADDGSYIIPVSKVTVAFLTGGGEYGKIRIFGNDGPPFAGGSGAIVSMRPKGFLLKDKEGKYKMISTDKEPLDTLVDMVEKFVEKSGESYEKP